MATLHQGELNLSHRFGPVGSIGRRPGADLQVPHRTCSLRHAEIRWGGDRWILRDLGSRNGTWVDGHRIEQAQNIELEPGMQLAFGHPPDTWEVRGVEPPVACASSPGRQTLFADTGTLTIPAREGPPLTLTVDEEGRWWVEHHGDPRVCPAEHEAWIDDVPWRIQAPSTAAVTTELKLERRIAGARLTFHVSSDEEQVEIEVLFRGIVTRVGSRSHSYLLLMLARRRLSDRLAGLPPEDEGWMHVADELVSSLGVHSPNDLHVQAHRARKQLKDHGIMDADHLFERKPGWVRLSAPDVHVVPEASENNSER